MSTVAQRLNGAKPLGERQRDDFYPTPPEGTEALLRVEKFDGAIWEPACGNGAISKVLQDNGYSVVSSDLINRGYGDVGVDFLAQREPRAPNIITNPPFKLSVPFVRTSLALASHKVAMLVQLRFLEGVYRGELFDEAPPVRVWVFRRRLPIPSGDASGTQGGMLAFAWFIWDQNQIGKTTELRWLK